MKNGLKRILIIGSFFPPSSMPASIRMYGFAKYFHKFGYYPVIVSRKWENHGAKIYDSFSPTKKNIDYINTPEYEAFLLPYNPSFRDRLFLKHPDHKLYSLLRKLLTFAENFLNGFSNRFHSYNNINRFADELLSSDNNYSAIIASGNPFLLFKFARNLSKKHGVPYILDYRDDWSTNEINQPKTFSQLLIRKFSIALEKKWIKDALFFTAVSEVYKNRIEAFTGKRGVVIMNGFFERYSAGPVVIKRDKLRFLYSGTLYKVQDISIFLNAFSVFLKKYGTVAEVFFVGAGFDSDQKKMLSGYNFGDALKILPRVPIEEMYNLYYETDVFLLFAYSDYRGVPSTKIFEYISYEKPILLCGSDHDILEFLITETGTGIVVNNSDEAYKEIDVLYNKRVNNNIVSVHSHPDIIKKYSRENQVRLFAGAISEKLSEINKYRQCKRCVMDTSDPEISFNSKGFCNHCTDFFKKTLKQTYQGKTSDKKLARLVRRMKKTGRNNKYDCVVGVGGGIDSSYTVYLVKKLGFRPLAVHMDNGWNSELAVSNLVNVLKKLDVDLYTHVLDWEEFRDLQLSFLKASVIEAETPTDIAILAALHHAAEKYNIKYIFSGGNFATEGILPKYWHYNAKDVKYLNAIHSQFGRKELKTFPTFNYKKEMYFKLVKGIRIIYLLNYVPFNKKEAIRILEEELGWKKYGGKHHESIYTKFIQSYILPEKFGIDYRRATFSTKICSGQISREEALKELADKPIDNDTVSELKLYICKKLCITPEEFDEIISRPPKTYKDYPNDEKWLKFIYSVYRTSRRIYLP